MSKVLSSPTRHSFIATSITAGIFGIILFVFAGFLQIIPTAAAKAAKPSYDTIK